MTRPDKDPESRAQELESIVDQLDAKVAREREAERVVTRGSENEPPD
jgi:hypothetical protein